MPSRHPVESSLIRGLIAELPDQGSVWPLERREAWIACARAVFDTLYEAAPAEASAAGRASACYAQDSAP